MKKSILFPVFLLVFGVPVLSTLTTGNSFVLAANTSPIEYRAIGIGDVVDGSINGTNYEDYYLVHFYPGFYNITLYTDGADIAPLDVDVFMKTKGQLFPFTGPVQVASDKLVLLQSFLPSVILPIDTQQPYYPDYFTEYEYSLAFEETFWGVYGYAPPEYAYMGYCCGLQFVYPPAGEYVLRVASYKEINYTLSIELMNEVKVISWGERAEVDNLEYKYYGSSFLGSAIFSFTPVESDMYVLNVSWTDPGDYVAMMVSDERGIVMSYLNKKGGHEHLYVVLYEGVTYYITATFSYDNMPEGPINVSVVAHTLHPKTISPGDSVVGNFTNPYDPEDELYILNYTPGYFYNVSLQVPSTGDYDLSINSPFYGTLSWNSLDSDLKGNGVDENITMFVSFVGMYMGLVDGGSEIAISTPILPPNPSSIIVRVHNVSGSGDYTLEVKSYPIPTYNRTTDEVIEFNEETHPWYKVFKIDKDVGFEYELTWKVNTSVEDTAPFLMIMQPMVEIFEAGTLVSDAVPEYSHTGTLSLLDNFLIPLTDKGMVRREFYSMSNSSAYVVLFSLEEPANMTLSIEERAAEHVEVGDKKAGSLNTGEGILYSIHLQPGVYRVVVNYTMAPTGSSLLYPSHPKPIIAFDENGNYVPMYIDYPFGEYDGNNASVLIYVSEEGDYYIWLVSKNPLMLFSETEYTIEVEALYVTMAPAGIIELIIQNAIWIGLGFGIGLVIAVIVAVKKR
ncbi:MAG: hypothetical protein ACTSVF_00630 [Candidatus Asgardarchaeia archaeon]